MRLSLVVAAAAVGSLALAACSGAPSKRTPPPDEAQPPTGQATPPAGGTDGASCLAAGDCASGVCEGQGCGDDQPGTCAPLNRGCTRDLRPYCGCDGVTFRTSGSCPGQRFADHGECPAR